MESTNNGNLNTVNLDADDAPSIIGARDRRLDLVAGVKTERVEVGKMSIDMLDIPGVGPMDISELSNETMTVAIDRRGRFSCEVYTHRFTNDLVSPADNIERRLRQVQRDAELAAKMGAPYFAPEDTPSTGDLFAAYRNIVLTLVKTWTLRDGGQVAPITAEWIDARLGIDIVGLIITRIRERLAPSKTKGATSA